MWGQLDLPWQAALEQAWMAYQAGCVPIGAVITGPDGGILACGRNRIDEPWPDEAAGEKAVFHSQLAHAELNALIALGQQGDRTGFDVHTCTLYTTVEPCPLCLGAWYMSGVRTLKYAARDPYAGSTNLLGCTPYLERKPVRADGPQQPALEDLAMALMLSHRRRVGRWMGEVVYETVAVALPTALHLAEALANAGVLERLAARQAPIEEVVHTMLDYHQPMRHPGDAIP